MSAPYAGPVTIDFCIYAVGMCCRSHSRAARDTDLAHVSQVPLNETLREDIASGYVSYEYGTVPGTVLDPGPDCCPYPGL